MLRARSMSMRWPWGLCGGTRPSVGPDQQQNFFSSLTVLSVGRFGGKGVLGFCSDWGRRAPTFRGIAPRLRSGSALGGLGSGSEGAVRQLYFMAVCALCLCADEEIFLWAWSSMPSGDATSAPKGCGLAPLGLPEWRCAGMSAD